MSSAFQYHNTAEQQQAHTQTCQNQKEPAMTAYKTKKKHQQTAADHANNAKQQTNRENLTDSRQTFIY